MQGNSRLTSSEITNLWMHYTRETMASCVTKYMLQTIKDPEIHRIYVYALEISERHLNRLREFFHKEHFPVPIGFTDEDVNLDAPPLFTDNFCLSHLHIMTMQGSQGYSISFNVSIRKDIRDFYYQCNMDTMDLYNKSLELSIAKNIITMAPYYKTPDHVEYVKNINYVTDVIGKHRSMNTMEAGNVFFNLEKSILTKAIILGFKQVIKKKDILQFMEKCLKTKNKHIATFSELLLKDNLRSPSLMDDEIIISNTAPFSEKLMFTNVGFLFSSAISYYGAALVTCMRADIAMLCEKAIMEDLVIFGQFGKMLINHHWLEQPPEANDRQLLSE